VRTISCLGMERVMEIHKPTVIMTSAAQEWKQGSQGYLQAEATVTLSAELPTYFGNLQDLLGFRASKSPPVRLLQIGVRPVDPGRGTAATPKLVLGVRGIGADGVNTYEENVLMDAIPGQHLHLTLLVPLEAKTQQGGDRQSVVVKILHIMNHALKEDTVSLTKLPVLFEGLDWQDYPRFVTHHRSELLVNKGHANRDGQSGRTIVEEKVDFGFRGQVHYCTAVYTPRPTLPTVLSPEFRSVVRGTIVRDNATLKITVGMEANLIIQMVFSMATSDNFSVLLDKIQHMLEHFPGPYSVVTGLHDMTEGQVWDMPTISQLDMQHVMDVTSAASPDLVSHGLAESMALILTIKAPVY